MHDTGVNAIEKSVKGNKGIHGRGQSEIETIDVHGKILSLRNEIEMNFIKLGGYLKLVNDNALYKEKGCQTFNEYIAMPELSFQRSTAYAIMGVYEDYIEGGLSETLDISGISYYKLDRIRQFKDEPIEVMKEWVLKAREDSLSDLNAEIRIAKGEKEEVYIPKTKSFTLTCPHCGMKFDHII